MTAHQEWRESVSSGGRAQGLQTSQRPLKVSFPCRCSGLLYILTIQYIRVPWLFFCLPTQKSTEMKPPGFKKNIHPSRKARIYYRIYLFSLWSLSLSVDAVSEMITSMLASVSYEAVDFQAFLWPAKSLEVDIFFFTLLKSWLLILWQQTSMFTGRKQTPVNFAGLLPCVFLECLIILYYLVNVLIQHWNLNFKRRA